MTRFSAYFAESGWCVLIETLDLRTHERVRAEWVADCGDFAAADELAQTLNCPLVTE